MILTVVGSLFSVGFCQTPAQSIPITSRLACFEGTLTVELLITSKVPIQVQGGTLTRPNDSTYVVSELEAGQRIVVLQLKPTNTIRQDVVIPVVDPQPLMQPLVSSSTLCGETKTAVLNALVANGQTADWYDARSGGTLLAAGQVAFVASRSGTYYAEARNASLPCLGVSSGRGEGKVTLQKNLCPLVSFRKVQL